MRVLTPTFVDLQWWLSESRDSCHSGTILGRRTDVCSRCSTEPLVRTFYCIFQCWSTLNGSFSASSDHNKFLRPPYLLCFKICHFTDSMILSGVYLSLSNYWRFSWKTKTRQSIRAPWPPGLSPGCFCWEWDRGERHLFNSRCKYGKLYSLKLSITKIPNLVRF